MRQSKVWTYCIIEFFLENFSHLIFQNCTANDPPCPAVCVERFGFEMNKKHQETILQVLLSPIMLLASDTIDRSESSDQHLKEGYLMLSGLQVLIISA